MSVARRFLSGGTSTVRRELLDGHHAKVVAIGITAFIGGTAEAMFLVAVTRAAFAITNGADRFGIVAGWYVDIGPGLAVALTLALARVAFAIFAGWQSASLSSLVVGRVQDQMAAAFLDATWATQQAVRSGNLQQLLTNHASHARVYITATAQAVAATANLLAMLGLAIAVDPLGAIVLVASVSVLATLLRPLRSAVHRRAEAASNANLEFAEEISRVSEIGLELHVFHVQEAVKRQVGESIRAVRAVGRRLQFTSALTTPIYVGLAYVALICALWAVSASNATSLTSIGAAMLVMLRSLSYGQALQTANTQLSSAAPSLELLFRQRDELRRGERHDGGERVDRIDHIEARQVTFSYDGDTPALRDISFEIGRREIIGVIGPSGSGKTTLVELLLGLRTPDYGQILANGRDISEYSRQQWARRVVFVPQTNHLLAGSIADNIRFFRSGIEQSRIEVAARLAHIHDEIVGFDLAYDRDVGERGDRLSGGQRQRICIARALVEQPDVLILDEPTSALDVRSEHLIRTSLLDLRKEMTIVVIAHRLSTLDICDRIMVIQGGELVGFDAPSELESTNPFYREALMLSGLR